MIIKTKDAEIRLSEKQAVELRDRLNVKYPVQTGPNYYPVYYPTWPERTDMPYDPYPVIYYTNNDPFGDISRVV